ncbi:MAG TPA: biopolymer transporter ExbD [Polyangiaceae bacterium]|nr:biopolymer transporter ExbD [Polyangiaceae bacterium]
MASSASPGGEPIYGINVTPLVDVVLVLLIILMVTSSYAVSKSLPLQLPKASTGESSDKGLLAISIDAAGALFLDGQPIAKPELRQRVRRRATAEETRALIAADGAVAHRSVVGVIDLLRAEGVSQLAINVAPEDSKP